MSFAAQMNLEGKFQLLEFTKEGVTYLIFYPAKDVKRVLSRFRKSGYLAPKEGFLMWEGTGPIPQDLDDALTNVGWDRKRITL